MSDTADVRTEVRARLEWLRLMGVESVRQRPGAAPPATEVPGIPARSPATPPEAPSSSTAAPPEIATPARSAWSMFSSSSIRIEEPCAFRS